MGIGPPRRPGGPGFGAGPPGQGLGVAAFRQGAGNTAGAAKSTPRRVLIGGPS